MASTALFNQVYPSADFVHKRGLSPSLRAILQQSGTEPLIREMSPRDVLWRTIVDHVTNHGFIGLVLTTNEHNRWGFLTRDPADDSHFRYTTFDHLGFIGHGTYATADEACIALFDMGFRVIDSPDKLDKLANGGKWLSD